MKPSLVLAACCLALLACPGDATLVGPKPEPVVDDHWSDVGTTDGGSAALGPEALGRRTRRLSVQQLERTLIELTGDTWRVGPAVPPIEVLPFLRTVLGQPDYLTEFRESLDIGPTFTKFVDNWASETCATMVLTDLGQSDPAKRRFVLTAVPASDAGVSDAQVRAAVEQNLRAAKLHFHAVYLPPGETAPLQPYVDVWQQLYLRNPGPNAPAFAWAGVCTLVLTDPELVTY